MNIFTSGWKATGKTVSVPQYELTVKVEEGKTVGIRTVLFPNILAELPMAYLQDKITEMLIDYTADKVDARKIDARTAEVG